MSALERHKGGAGMPPRERRGSKIRFTTGEMKYLQVLVPRFYLGLAPRVKNITPFKSNGICPQPQI